VGNHLKPEELTDHELETVHLLATENVSEPPEEPK
jgi:hypothetical protein